MTSQQLRKKGMLESEISKAFTQWEKDYLGRGSVKVKTDIVRHMIIVVVNGILTPAEQELAKDRQGMLSIKKIRADLIETGNAQLKQIIYDITGENVKSFHTDISIPQGERVIIFMLHSDLQAKIPS
ncbi:DUF2294 domain-containing protein [Bacillus sp. FJAT-44742]|uniref:DUF2294 domain-containing protein n=1 Tax=Bacillus sp. FJAT-44742 TaxID=2014005 RepID=UPI000C239982|nr:DUF2294 domain-containing protein [Bacillus sp. FJAT-44742]